MRMAHPLHSLICTAKTARGAGNRPPLSFHQLLLSNYQNKKHSSPLMHSSLLEQPLPLPPDLAR